MPHRRYAWLGLFNGLAGSRSDVTQTCDVTRVFLACLTVYPCDGGTGQNVVELVQEQRFPNTVQLFARIDIVRVLDAGRGAQVFGDTQH